MRVAILTLSDKGSRGERDDLSGPAVASWLGGHGCQIVDSAIIPDDYDSITAMLSRWCDSGVADIIVTTGGTGVSPRDVTPEATVTVCDRLIPGIAELMRLKSLEITPMAALSRAVAGIRRESLIINLPGSPKGAVENLAAVWPVLKHATEKIKGDMGDCASL